MNFIDKILLEGLWRDADTVFDIDYFTQVSSSKIKQKAEIVARKFGVNSIEQAKSGSCYFVIFNPHNHFIYEVRISTHPSNKRKNDKFYQTIELSYSLSIPEMVRIIKNKLRQN